MPFSVSVKVDAGQQLGSLHPIYRFFGADEPNYAYMKDGEALLKKLGDLGPRKDQVYFRAHSLLCTGDGTPALKWGSTNAYNEDVDGNPIYDFTIIDRIFDTYLERGIKPYLQVGFMPKALSRHPEPYQHKWTPTADYSDIYTGWATPPTDYAKWAELVYQWAKHCVDRYGKAECEKWYWECWNEPNIGYWRGTPEEFYALHDYTMDAVRRALPTARCGGPETAHGGAPFLRDFFEHALRGKNAATGKIGSELDFVAFHAKGEPVYQGSHVRMGIAKQLKDIDDAFAMIASFPELKRKPIVIGESDPEGCAAAQGPQLGYRNGTMYSSYTAASFSRKHDLMEKHGVNLEGALTWAFEFEDQPYFDGFRVLASNNVDLPVLNVFRMFARLGDVRVKAVSDGQIALDKVLKEGIREQADVGTLATVDSDGTAAQVFLWHYHDDDLPGESAKVDVEVMGLKWNGLGKLTHYRIDQKHSNAYEVWKDIGKPQAPSAEQYKALQEAGQLASIEAPKEVHITNGAVRLSIDLPRQGVSLLIVEKA